MVKFRKANDDFNIVYSKELDDKEISDAQSFLFGDSFKFFLGTFEQSKKQTKQYIKIIEKLNKLLVNQLFKIKRKKSYEDIAPEMLFIYGNALLDNYILMKQNEEYRRFRDFSKEYIKK